LCPNETGGPFRHAGESRPLSPSERVDVDDRLGEGLRCFLRQVVPDTAADCPVLVLAGTVNLAALQDSAGGTVLLITQWFLPLGRS
jgi:hypothetical protein